MLTYVAFGRRRTAMAALVALPFVLASTLPASAQNALLIPDWANKRVMSFSAADGSLLNANFITTGPSTIISQPVAAISSGKGTILVSDALTKGVFEYNLDGTYNRTLVTSAAAGGGAVKGIDVFNGELYAVISSGTYAQTVQKFNVDTGARIGTFISGLTNATDVDFRANDALVTDRITTTKSVVAEYSLAGAFSSYLVNSTGTNDINFPYQVTDAPGGHVLVGGFAQPSALYEYDANFAPVTTFGGGTGRFIRGGARLDNGNTLYTANNFVTVVDAGTGVSHDLLTSGNFQLAHRVNLTPVPEPGTLSLLALGLAALPWRRRRI